MVMDHCVLFPKEHIYSLIQVTSTLSCHGDWLSNMKARELPWGKGGASPAAFSTGKLNLDTTMGRGLRNMF